MSELRIIIPSGIALRAPIYVEDIERVADVLTRQLPIIAAENGRATAVIVKDGITHFIAGHRGQQHEIR